MKYLLILLMILFAGCTSGETVKNAVLKDNKYEKCAVFGNAIGEIQYVNANQTLLVTQLTYACQNKEEILERLENVVKDLNVKND